MEYSPNKPKDIIIRFTDDDHVWINSRSFISLRRFQEAVNDARQGGKNEHISNVSPTVELKWIPCSEQLPERDGRYLVTNSAWGSWTVYVCAWIGHWHSDDKPIAWMELPEEWKGEKDETTI